MSCPVTGLSATLPLRDYVRFVCDSDGILYRPRVVREGHGRPLFQTDSRTIKDIIMRENAVPVKYSAGPLPEAGLAIRRDVRKPIVVIVGCSGIALPGLL